MGHGSETQDRVKASYGPRSATACLDTGVATNSHLEVKIGNIPWSANSCNTVDTSQDPRFNVQKWFMRGGLCALQRELAGKYYDVFESLSPRPTSVWQSSPLFGRDR